MYMQANDTRDCMSHGMHTASYHRSWNICVCVWAIETTALNLKEYELIFGKLWYYTTQVMQTEHSIYLPCPMEIPDFSSRDNWY